MSRRYSSSSEYAAATPEMDSSGNDKDWPTHSLFVPPCNFPNYSVDVFETPFRGSTDSSPAVSHRREHKTMVQDSIVEDSEDEEMIRRPVFSDGSDGEPEDSEASELAHESLGSDAVAAVEDTLASDEETLPEEEAEESYQLRRSRSNDISDGENEMSNNNHPDTSLTEETLKKNKQKHSLGLLKKPLKPVAISEDSSADDNSRPGSSASHE